MFVHLGCGLGLLVGRARSHAALAGEKNKNKKDSSCPKDLS